MRRRWVLATLLLLCSGAARGLSPRISFTRTVPAARDLSPAQRLAVLYATGESAKIDTFVAHFVDAIGRSDVLHADDAVAPGVHATADEPSLRALRRAHPADAYLGVSRFTCTSEEKQGDGSSYDATGERVRRTLHWVDAICSARIDAFDRDGKRIVSYAARGEGTSPRSPELTADERDVAFEQAARYAAVSAAEAITPRVIRESIELDDSAPAFDEGYAMIRAERFEDARAIWLAAASRHSDAAALFYDLAVVSEALGDVAAAREYYAKAVRLAPGERRYVTERRLFLRRNERAAERRP